MEFPDDFLFVWKPYLSCLIKRRDRLETTTKLVNPVVSVRTIGIFRERVRLCSSVPTRNLMERRSTTLSLLTFPIARHERESLSICLTLSNIRRCSILYMAAVVTAMIARLNGLNHLERPSVLEMTARLMMESLENSYSISFSIQEFE